MAYLPAKQGAPLAILSNDFKFSFFAMRRTTRRWGLNSRLYAADPWAVILLSLDQIRASERDAGDSFVRQAREYFSAAERATAIETQPLLYYYSFMNLAKALALTRRRPGIVGKVSHGINIVGGSGHSVGGARWAFIRRSLEQCRRSTS